MSRDEAARAIVAAIPPNLARRIIAYMADVRLAAGDSLQLDRQAFVVPRPLWLGFVDLLPGANWGHSSLYVLCDANGDGVEVRPAQFPPVLETGRALVLRVGEDVPSWARPRS